MNELTTHLQEAIGRQIHQCNYELASVTPVSPENLSSLMNQSGSGDALTYLIQVRPKTVQPPEKPLNENVYLGNGKLNIPFLFRNAELLFEASEYQLARNIYKTIIQSGEYISTALFRSGKCFEAEGKVEEAQASYEESIAFNPTLECYQKLSALLLRQNREQKAAEVMERALNLKDITASVRYELHKACGNCWTRAQSFSEAERHFKKALEIYPSADEARANLGVLYLQSNRPSDARRNFEDAIASNPSNPQALAGLGSCALLEKDTKAAHDYFAKSLEIHLNNPTAVFYLVKCAYDIKSYAVAAKFLSEYIQIAPVTTNLLYSLAGLQFHLGRMDEAKITTLRILDLQPQHLGAKDLLSIIERYTGAGSA